MAPFADAVAGSVGAAFATVFFFPIDTAKTRVQVKHARIDSVASCM